MDLASFLESRGFSLPNDEPDYEPDTIVEYRGFKIGSDIPNGGALTVEIFCEGRWYAVYKEGDPDWDYTRQCFERTGKQIIDDWFGQAEA